VSDPVPYGPAFSAILCRFTQAFRKPWATGHRSYRSAVPAPKQKGLDYSVLVAQAGTKTYKGLGSAVIYGANASGKTSIIGAMDTFKQILDDRGLLEACSSDSTSTD